MPNRFRNTLHRLNLAALQFIGLAAWIEGYVKGDGGLILACAALFAITAAIFGIGRLRAPALLVWTGCSILLSAIIVLFGVHSQNWGSGADHLGDLFGTIVLAGVFNFMGYVFVAAADIDRRTLANYSTLFLEAWSLATLLLLAGLTSFVVWTTLFGVFWLMAGADIAFSWVTEICMPASGLILVALLHIADRRPEVIDLPRRWLVTALSWLLPIAVLAILVPIIWAAWRDVRGIWRVDEILTTPFLMSFFLMLLINAQYGDGKAPGGGPHFLVQSRMVAIFLLLLLVMSLAALEIRDFRDKGWTPYGIDNSATLIVLACVAVGYAATALKSGAALRALPTINVVSALASMALIVASATPLLDAKRLAVDYQLDRLMSGRIAPSKFDYDMLFFDAGPYGIETLRSLALSAGNGRANEIAERAGVTLKAASLGHRKWQ